VSLRLRIEHGQGAGKTVRLPQAGVYTLGRIPQCSMRVLDMKVSKKHCEIHLSESDLTTATLVDLGSTHGCLVNGQPVNKETTLNPGDELRLGMTILRVLSNGEADENLKPDEGREASAGNGKRRGHEATAKQTLPADALVGKELSGYAIEKKIGAGGMGGVYLAEQVSLKRKVALKVLNEKFAADSAFVDQFVNEARAAGALNHPNVVQVYDVGQAAGNYFFSMEVMPGGSIEERVREGDVEWEEGLNWFIDAANALIFAKRREILHRDVKPDNLMLAENGSAKLCDLGLAKKSEVQDLMDQGIIGTPHFISPEAIRRKSDIDHRTDLYSLGCTFFRVFSGKNPFPGQSVKEILLGHLNKPVPHISDVKPDVPHEIDEIVAKLMAKEPDERFQTPEELLRALDKVRTQYHLEAHGIKPGSRKPLIIGAVAAVIAIGVAIFFATREPEVYVQPKTEAEKLADLQKERAAVEGGLLGAVGTAQLALGKLEGEERSGSIETQQNWKKAIWAPLIQRFEERAADWKKTADDWTAQGAKEEDEVIRGYYTEYGGQLAGFAETATTHATELKDYIAERRELESKIDEETKKLRDWGEKALAEHAAKVKKAFDEKKFMDAERLLHPQELKKITDKLEAGEVKGKVKVFKLLDYKDDIVKMLDKHFPGDKDGANRGAKTIEDAVKAIDQDTRAVIEKAQSLLGKDPGPDEYAAAIKALEDFENALPEVTDEDRKFAPRTSAAYVRARNAKIEVAIRDYTKTRQKVIVERYAVDRAKHFKLIHKAWAPRELGGLLRSFELQAAIDQAELTADVMEFPDYKARAKELALAATALKALMTRFQETFDAKEWVDTDFYYTDERGRRKKEKIRGVDARGITWDKDLHTYAEIGPKELLATFLAYDDGDEAVPRFACTPADHVGLGVMAELAGDYDRARRHFETATQNLPADDPRVAMMAARMARHPQERMAAELYLAIRAAERRADAWAAAFEAIMNGDGFSKEDRSQVLSEVAEINKALQLARGNLEQLLSREDLAGTEWGSSVRQNVHPKVAYVGEPLAEAVPPREVPPPKKPGDGDGKDEGKGNGGGDAPPKKPGGAGANGNGNKGPGK
jgi:pSer/pThr/pTyr-binding forkhead associated (FHA) protein